MKKVLYLGNDLAKGSKYHSAYATLKNNLINQGYTLKTASSQKNQGLRLVDMILSVLFNAKKVDYILIDTFSTSAFYYVLICSQIARLLKVKYIPILHGGNLPERLEKSPKMCKLIFENSKKNIAPSTYLQKAFAKKGYRSILIPNTIDIKDYIFKERKEIKPNILYVRAFAKIYNPVLAIRVLKNIQKVYPKATLCMVGPDRDGTLEQVKNEISKGSLEDSVRLTGVLPKEEWHKLSEDYDVFINTTDVDNTPVSLIETMALGMPIVSTNVGGIPDLMEDKTDCFLVEANDEAAMASAILELLKNENKTNQFSLKGREKAENMDWEIVKSQWEKI